jgi:hypothetical protein
MPELGPTPQFAIVSRCDVLHEQTPLFLQYSPDGTPCWIDDPEAATAFDSMREATRAALHLPAALRAYSLPRPRDDAPSARNLN